MAKAEKMLCIKRETHEKLLDEKNRIYKKTKKTNTFDKTIQHLLQKESLAETLLNEFDCITSIEMAENIAENIFESGSLARDTVECLAQNYIENKED